MMRFFKFVILMLLPLFSQAYGDHTVYASRTGTADYQLLKLHYENSSGEKGVTTFHYDGNGIMHRSFWTLLDGSRYGWSYHTYDSKENMILKYREFSDSLTSSKRMSYDDRGNLIEDDYQRSDGLAGKVFYRYDSANRQIEADCQKMNGWFVGKIRYEYDSNNRKSRAVISQDGNPMGSIRYDYDAKGRLVREHWDLGGRWTQTFSFEYRPSGEYLKLFCPSSNIFIRNTGKYRLVKEVYDYSGQAGGPSFFHYDESGMLVKKIFESSAGFKTETTYDYDDLGRLIASHRHYSDGKKGKFTYEYDGNRRIVRRPFERSDGLKGMETYEYDARGALIKGRWENFDSWLTGDLTFQSDDRGRLVSGKFTGDKFNADIDFDVDEAGNVIRIHWKFSYDEKATQTYAFEYEKINDLE